MRKYRRRIKRRRYHFTVEKQIFKEALAEWLASKWGETTKSVGKWFIKCVFVLIFAWLVYYVLQMWNAEHITIPIKFNNSNK